MWLGIGDAVEHWAKYKADKIALTVGRKKYTFKTLFERALDISTFFADLGINGRVAVGVCDKFDYLACIVGLNLVGNSIIILNPLAKIDALRIHLADTEPTALIGYPSLLRTIEEGVGKSIRSFDIKKITKKDAPRNVQRSEVIEWGILFSSGSTGISKAIIYNHQAMTSELLAWCLELGIRRGTRFFVGRPIFYTGGLVLTLATLLVGGEVVLPEYEYDSDFRAIWDYYQEVLSECALDLAFFVPDQLRTFMTLSVESHAGPTILVMGSPISGEEKKKASAVLKSKIIESWGNSEGLGTITDEDDLVIRPGSIGRPFLTEKIFIVTDDLAFCPPGQNGRLAGQDENMFLEYANRPDATKRVKKRNLILSDDIGYMDSNYYYYIMGRDQESFIINGRSVFLSDLEKKIRKMNGVTDVCVVATEATGTTSFHVLIIFQNSTPVDLLKKEIEIKIGIELAGCILVDELPRLASGKIDRLEAARVVLKMK